MPAVGGGVPAFVVLDDAAACVELECCPPGTSVPAVQVSRPLLVEAGNPPPVNPLDDPETIQAEDFLEIVT